MRANEAADKIGWLAGRVTSWRCLMTLACLAGVFLLGCGSGVQARPRTRVPRIAQFLGVRVGANGYRALEWRYGRGLASIGGHPNSTHSWQTASPRGIIETDGFSLNGEGYVVESLAWKRIPADAVRRLPVAHVPAQRFGWLGTVYPGMRRATVERLVKGRLPAPEKHGDKWTWSADGYVRPSVPQTIDAYRTWTATLQFQGDRLQSIQVECE